jgi:hypothetical protein
VGHALTPYAFLSGTSRLQFSIQLRGLGPRNWRAGGAPLNPVEKVVTAQQPGQMSSAD